MAFSVEALREALLRLHREDKDRTTLRQALRGAGYFRLTTEIGRIEKYFDSDDEDLREDALFAYALAMPGATTRGRVRGMLRKVDSITELSAEETQLVMFALDERLRLEGLQPVFEGEEESGEEDEEPASMASTLCYRSRHLRPWRRRKEAGSQRPMPLRQREEIQEVPRRLSTRTVSA